MSAGVSRSLVPETLMKSFITAYGFKQKQIDPTSSNPPYLAWGPLLALLGAAGLLLGLAWPVLIFWWAEFTNPISFYSHGPLVPPVAALILWRCRDRLRVVALAPAPIALIFLLPAVTLLIQAVRLGSGWIGSLSLILTFASSAWLLFGSRWMRVARPAFAFLLLMSPLPSTLLNQATFDLQLLSTTMAAHLLCLVGCHAVASGTLIVLPGFTLWVAAPCSGFKLMLSMVTFGAAFALLLDGSPARRLGLLLATLPFSLIINTVRVALVATAGAWSGPAAAHKVDAQGALIALTLSFVTFYFLAKGLQCRTLAGWPLF